MRVPNARRAWIPPLKLTGYLLSTTHPVGSAKAGFFRSFGFSDQAAEVLEAGLLHVVRSNEVAAAIRSPFGVKYEVDGAIETPSGKVVTVRTVWIVETGEVAPRFVTAFPTS